MTAALAAAALCVGCGTTPKPAPAHVMIANKEGRIPEYVAAFARRIPGRASGDYDTPDPAERSRLTRAFRAIQAGHLERAAAASRQLGYEVVRFADESSGANLVLLEEQGTPERRPVHGWGLFVRAVEARAPVTIEAPHPLADQHSEDVAAELFAATRAENLFVAGAHRDADASGAADVAHRADSMFAALDRVATRPGDLVVQVHGFDVRGHPGYGDVALSSTRPSPGPRVLLVARGLRRAGYRVCVYDGAHCSALGATTNVEGAAARSRGVTFLHLELAHELRADPRARRQLVQVLAPLVRRAARMR